MNVIVTGASGFIGQSLVNTLIAQGLTVYAVVRNEQSNKEGLSKDAKIIYADFDHYSILPDLLKDLKIDLFYHLAWDGTSGLPRQDYVRQLNSIEATLVAYEIANRMQCKRFITTGTISERLVDSIDKPFISNPNLMYAIAKSTTYKMLIALSARHKTPFVWAQLSNIYGENNLTGNLVSYTLDTLISNGKLAFTKAEQPYDLMHIDDVTTALYLLGVNSDLSTNHYFIGSGEPRLLKEYLSMILKMFGHDGTSVFGLRPDDYLTYEWSWFDTKSLIDETGFKVTNTFEKHIEKMIFQLRSTR